MIVAFGLSMLRLAADARRGPAREAGDGAAGRAAAAITWRGRGGTAVGRLALEELVSRYPSQPNAHYALGTYIAPDDPDAAAEEFQKELRLDPDHAEALIQIAHLRDAPRQRGGGPARGGEGE